MLHASCRQGNRVDSRLLVVRNQIVNLTPDLSFGHTLCFRCPNGSWKPSLDIYVPRVFQWYKEILNPLSFDPCNCPLKIWKSTGTQIPKVEAPLGVWRFIPSHFLTLLGTCSVTPELPSCPATLQALALVASPRLGLRQWLYMDVTIVVFHVFLKYKKINKIRFIEITKKKTQLSKVIIINLSKMK
jgi:hypothetical protein